MELHLSWSPHLENPTKGKQGVQEARAIPRGRGLQRQEPSQVTKQALSSGGVVKQRPAEASFRVRLRSKGDMSHPLARKRERKQPCPRLRALSCAHRQLGPLRTTLFGEGRDVSKARAWGPGLHRRPERDADLTASQVRSQVPRAQHRGSHRKSEATPGTAFLISEKDHQREAAAPGGVGSAPAPSRGPAWARQGSVLPAESTARRCASQDPCTRDLGHRRPANCPPPSWAHGTHTHSAPCEPPRLSNQDDQNRQGRQSTCGCHSCPITPYR